MQVCTKLTSEFFFSNSGDLERGGAGLALRSQLISLVLRKPQTCADFSGVKIKKSSRLLETSE